jgi:hypothetical protein
MNQPDEHAVAMLTLRASMGLLQRDQKPHESIALLLDWLFLPAGDPRQAAAAEIAQPMFEPGVDPRSTIHPGDPRFQPRLVVIEIGSEKLNVGVRINAFDSERLSFIQYPPLEAPLQDLLERRVLEIAGLSADGGPEAPPTE